MFCGKCGKETENNSQFCIHCGNKLFQDRSLQSTPVRNVPANHQPSQKIVAPIGLTKRIIACRKTAVQEKGIGVSSYGPTPPYTVRELRNYPLSPVTYINTTYKVFEIEHDKSESSEKIWKCPLCNEEVKVINRKAGARSQNELDNLVEEQDKPRRKWRIILPAIFLISLGFCITNPGISNSSWGLFFFGIVPGLGIGYLFLAHKTRGPLDEEQESGYIYIENPQTHRFLISATTYMIDSTKGDIGHESSQETTPESELQIVGEIIYKPKVLS
jgi:hypothetical protein